MVREGETFEHKKVKVEIREVMPQFDPAGRPTFMVSYRIVDGKYVSPIARWWQRRSEDPRKHVEELVDYYLSIMDSLKGSPP